MIKINFYHKCGFKLSSGQEKRIIGELKKIFTDIKNPAIIDISFIGKEEIKQLNQKHRQINRATDTLSFPLYENLAEIKIASEKINPLHLGEIIICPEFVNFGFEKIMFYYKRDFTQPRPFRRKSEAQ
ncbi:MAG: hypothetical protein CEN89_566 [Candidatus Berkelbacteria bacterium Licking1014_7]|uniref:rRNA maturation factor n=1 Tax=Candidatus Berkelbacteria bacterium Licking1014_7 TaxID=2017147 RepID=A0A554LID1_9BACT|nr:MAG: hypothetical protein CEN89_566 [Candidatus Berkelbacteria bacterium Licking1014_7]